MPSSPTKAYSSSQPPLSFNSTISMKSPPGQPATQASRDPISPRALLNGHTDPMSAIFDQDPNIKYRGLPPLDGLKIHDTVGEWQHRPTGLDHLKLPLHGAGTPEAPEEPRLAQPDSHQSRIHVSSDTIRVFEARSWPSSHSTPSIGAPLLQYDFNSAQTSPVIRAKSDVPDHTAVTTHLALEHEYSYVPIMSNQLRLLQVSKGRRGERIHCSLKILRDEQLETPDLVYQALSYAWGSVDDAIHDIFLRDIDILEEGKSIEELVILASHQIIPRRFYIRANLYHALQQLRSPTDDLWFWVDAICIDQANNAEKSHQLEKMLDIYCSAHNVCIWIGDSEPLERDGSSSSSTAMDFIPHLINLKLLDRVVSGFIVDERIAVCCRAFAKLLRRPWFSRRWVIQEVTAARQASVQCGSKVINWIDFADAVELFIANIGGIRSMYNRSAMSRVDPDALNHIESAGAKAIVSSVNDILRRAQDGTIMDRQWNIETLVTTFLHFEASDPHDTIYALLALARDGHFSPSLSGVQMPALKPDYRRNPVQTYIAFVQHCILSGESLDIICRHWALPLPELLNTRTWGSQPVTQRAPHQNGHVSPKRLPSWIGLASDSPFGPPSRFTGRLNGDSLVGEPGRPIYNSSRGATMAISFERYQPPQHHTLEPTASNGGEIDFSGILRVAGLKLGRVTRATSRVVDGTVSDECLEMVGWEGNRQQNHYNYHGSGRGDVNAIPDRLWRTLVANRAAAGQRGRHTTPPQWYRRACIYCLQKLSPEGDLNTARLLASAVLPDTALEFLRRVQAVVWSRKFLLCQDLWKEGATLFGLGPRFTREGDIICILYGCSVPVVLRPLEESQFELVGECYIHDHMEGQTIAAMDKEAVEKRTEMFDLL